MHRSGVYKEPADIFNCSFESPELGKNGKLFVENGLCGIYDSALTTPALRFVARLRAFTGW
jgi:hypothetical protein